MEKELPKLDMPENWVAGTDISKELLGLYTNFPVRLKCEVCILCMGGEIEASINLKRVQVHAGDTVLLSPGVIIQIHRVEGDLKIYFLGFSGKFVEQRSHSKSIMDVMYLTLVRPVISLKSRGASLVEDYMKLLIKLYENTDESIRNNFADNVYNDTHTAANLVYRNKNNLKEVLSKNEQLCSNFTQLVIQHYAEIRNVDWYAEQLQITHAHLCTVVKRVTGRTCMDIISSMVIMNAKSQLKLTHLTVQEISDSLNFANVSFFGKYFKRYVGSTPLEYRNSRT